MSRHGRLVSWAYKLGWLFLHGQDVVRLLQCDQELGVLALSVQSVRGTRMHAYVALSLLAGIHTKEARALHEPAAADIV